jgi:hypothetical protein
METTRPRWKSILKWIGLYFLVQIIAVPVSHTGVPPPVFSFAALGALVVHHLVTTRRARERLARERRRISPPSR